MKLYAAALLMFIAPVVRANFSEKHFNLNMANVDQWSCESKDDEIVSLSNSLKTSDEFYMAAKIASIMKEKYRNEERVRLERKISQNDSLSQEERIIYAFTLLKSKIIDSKKIENLINFTSDVPSVEAYRLFAAGYLSMRKFKNIEAYDFWKKSFSLIPYVDTTILYSLIFADTRRTDVLKNSKDYDKYIQAIPNSDAEKFRLTALTSRLGKTAAPSDILENFKKAYELCPHSSSIASEYGSELLLYRKLPEAERILIKLVKPDNSQSVLVDLNLAQIYYHLHKNSRADYFINIAMDKRNETTPSNRKEIERWKRKGQRIADAEYFIADCIHFLTSPFGIAMEILYFLLIILIIRKVMKSRSSK